MVRETNPALRLWTPEARMVSVSFLVLYLELALIRWVPGYVHNFGYFTNFAMLAAFLGIGVGCLLSGRGAAVAWLPCALLALAAIVRFADVQVDLGGGGSASAVFWSEPILQRGGTASATGSLLVAFLAVTFAVVGLGPRAAAWVAARAGERLPSLRGRDRLVSVVLVAAAYAPVFLLAWADLARSAGARVDLDAGPDGALFWVEPVVKQPPAAWTTGIVFAIFVFITLAFVGLGQPLGALFGELPRLRAYALNVVGGLAGILVFALHSRFEHPPIVWFSVCAALSLPLLAATPRSLWAIHGLVLAMFLGVVAVGTRGETWSPYYRQTLIRGIDGYMLSGNGVPGITLADFDHLPNTAMYAVPYSDELKALRRRPDAPVAKVLVVGCGGGNDVAMALARGAGHVDAVDINPWVIEMGKQHHPLRPLSSDRVTTYVADGRELLARSGETYDLIVYGLPDSTYTNDRSNLRVESFIFTEEAFRSVRARLSDDGVFVVYNYYRVPWIVEKIGGMLRDVFAQEPYVRTFTGPAGEPLPLLPAALAVGPGLRLPPPAPTAAPRPATDDWPFLYLTSPSVPGTYLGALAAVGLLSVLLVLGTLRLSGPPAGERESPLVHATLFFMGVAFVLLETRSVVTFGLFFGSTWWNNVAVFAAIHVSVLLAVLVAAVFPRAPRWAMASALLASLAFAAGVPPEWLLVGGTATRAVLAGTVAFLPIFCANVLFASVFGAAKEGRVSYAMNLLGGMIGGLFEYVSLVIGYRALVVVAAAFYVAALVAMRSYAVSRPSGPRARASS